MGELSRGQRDSLLFGAVAGTVAVTCGGMSLLWSIPALILAGAVYCAVRRILPEGKSLAAYMPVWMLVPELLFLILAAAKTASHAADCWPGHSAWQLFALALLALAGASALQGTDAVGRCAVLLTAGSILFYVPVLGAAAWQSTPPAETGSWKEGIPVLLTALTVVCSLFLPSQKRSGRMLAGLAGFTVLLLYVTAGRNGKLPVLTAVRGITLFGAAQRFEAVASCVLTVGLFLMLALFAASGGEILGAMGAGNYGALAVTVPAGAAVWWVDAVHPAMFVVGAALFWGVFPLLLLPVVACKSRKNSLPKNEKRC